MQDEVSTSSDESPAPEGSEEMVDALQREIAEFHRLREEMTKPAREAKVQTKGLPPDPGTET